jgi:hypothetical protein
LAARDAALLEKVAADLPGSLVTLPTDLTEPGTAEWTRGGCGGAARRGGAGSTS